MGRMPESAGKKSSYVIPYSDCGVVGGRDIVESRVWVGPPCFAPAASIDGCSSSLDSEGTNWRPLGLTASCREIAAVSSFPEASYKISQKECDNG